MAWVHDTGYAPAYDHTGYPVAVRLDGSETGSHSGPGSEDVIGWRSGCDCGWRGAQFYPRSEWPSSSGLAPEAVDGWETGTAASAEWARHLSRGLPLLAVHDLARDLADIEQRLRDAVREARHAGVSWSGISAAAGMTTDNARERWASAVPGVTGDSAGSRPRRGSGAAPPGPSSNDPPLRGRG
jgi:hypothetical protein